MTENILNFEYCKNIVLETKNLLLYTHIPAALAVLLLTTYVYFKSKKSPLVKILFGIGSSFCLWVILNLIIWLKFDSPSIVMSAWAPIEAIKTFIFFLCWYFVYFFSENKDFSKAQKTFWTILFIGIFGFSISSFNLSAYYLPECIAVENPIFTKITFWVQLFISAILFIFTFFKFFTKKDSQDRKKLVILSASVFIFILSFLILGKVSEATQNYSYEAIGLFGIVIFVGAMSYLILKYSLFSIKLIAVQILVVALVLLTASQLSFTEGYTTILAILTTLLSIFFGYLLIKSVKKEIKQKQRLQELTLSLEKSNLSLAEANDKLKGLDKLKTEFLSLASHQLRSPLTAIKGYASMLSEGAFGSLDSKQDEAIKRIYTSAQGLTNIVEDLLNVSKIEQGGMKYEFSPTSLSTIVTTLYNEMKVPAESKSLEFSLEMDSHDQYIVSADATKIKQVFLNLVDNSIKYTPKGFVKIFLKREGANIIFSVLDSGMGISPETRAKLFEKFSRGEGGKTNTGGSGLGLYLAQQIARAHKGDVTIESPGLGKGSTFIVTLPASGSYPN